MKLQLALDTLTLSECIELLDEISSYIDIIEVGTPFIIEEGLRPVKEFKQRYPHCEVLADVKIMDGGEFEAYKCFKAGADIVTVLGVAFDQTIDGVIRAAKNHGGKVLVDMIGVKNLKERTVQLDEKGVDYICVHTAFDLQSSGASPVEELKTITALVKNAKAAVAGGLKLNTLPAVIEENAEIIVVGGGITNAEDKVGTCLAMRALLDHE